MDFKLISPYRPTGDQPEAIDELSRGILDGTPYQTLLGVTGSGKTFTMANVIERVQKPTLILSHNKTLAAQLYNEFKSFFPENAVEYFVSYYDYYQPEAYIPSTDTYIEKDLAINEEIDRLRLSTTSALLSGRKDVIVVSSVSCLYGIGNPEDFHSNVIDIKVGDNIGRNRLLRHFVDSLYSRNEIELSRGNFRVKGDTVDIYLAYDDVIVRIEFWGEEIESIRTIDPATGNSTGTFDAYKIFPANLFVTTKERIDKAIGEIEIDLGKQVEFFKSIGKKLRSQTALRTGDLRCGDDSGNRPLLGDRKLFPIFRRPRSGNQTFLPARLFSQRLPNDYRREPCDRTTNPSDVRRRPIPQNEFGRIRIPTTCRRRQPAFEIRRIRRIGSANHLCKRHSRRL